MSTADRLLLILHIGFAIFALGPLTAVLHSTPRYIREGNATVLRFLSRTTQIYAGASLGVLLFGLFLASGKFDQVWLSASMTLYIVSLVLLVIVERDQRKCLSAIEASTAEVPAAPATETKDKTAPAAAPDMTAHLARISSLSGIITLLWIIILILMVWH
ncbi:hypothetical protein [Actinocorallia longicatena]|uniref:DUF2269 family protein n=1 Tax=Actinocorallia longicatena TaxID=111803 RepID=A0ABP6Q1J0_9ACTN